MTHVVDRFSVKPRVLSEMNLDLRFTYRDGQRVPTGRTGSVINYLGTRDTQNREKVEKVGDPRGGTGKDDTGNLMSRECRGWRNTPQQRWRNGRRPGVRQ